MNEITLDNLIKIEELHNNTEMAKKEFENAKLQKKSIDALHNLATKYSDCHRKESKYLTDFINSF